MSRWYRSKKMTYMCELLQQLPQWALGLDPLGGTLGNGIRHASQNPCGMESLCISDSAPFHRRQDLLKSPTIPSAGCVTGCHWALWLCHWGHLWPSSWSIHPYPYTHTQIHTHTHTHTHRAALLLLLFSPCFIFFRKSGTISIIIFVEYPEVNFNH